MLVSPSTYTIATDTALRDGISTLMKYRDLRDFIAQLEKLGELKRVRAEVDPYLEMTEICDRVLKKQGPAILFEKPKGHSIPVLGNLFGVDEFWGELGR